VLQSEAALSKLNAPISRTDPSPSRRYGVVRAIHECRLYEITVHVGEEHLYEARVAIVLPDGSTCYPSQVFIGDNPHELIKEATLDHKRVLRALRLQLPSIAHAIKAARV